MKVLSLFSGVGGFDLGLEAAGMETVALCEWDKKAASVLRRHWSTIPIYGDVSDLTGTRLFADNVLPDLVAFGSPCQDLSVAGKRAGLAGERSGLFHEAIRIIRELRELTNGTLPRWVIWENVVGALNSNSGADFGAVINEMGNLGACFTEWAVLDAQNFGVAQRRRRVFLVACLDPRVAGRCPDPLLPVREGSPRDLVPLRTAWKESAGSVASRFRGRDYALIDGTRVGDVRVYDEPVQTLKARMGTGGNTVPLVMRQREGKEGGGKGPLVTEQSLTLATGNDQTVFQPVVFEPGAMSRFGGHHWTEVAPTLRAQMGDNQVAVGQPVADPLNFDEYNFTGGTDTHHALRAGTPQSTGVAQPFTKSKRAQSTEDNETWIDAEIAPTLNLMDNSGESRATVLVPYRQGSFGQYVENEVGTLKASGGDLGGGSETFLATPYAVRRLLPIECERLMGWPDDWTRWDADGKEQADSHRYKQTGNGVASPVAQWVGRHIFAADAIGRAT